MPALYLVLVSALVALLAYRTYGPFLAAPARVQTVLTLAIMARLAVVMADGLVSWMAVLRGRRATVRAPGQGTPEAIGS